MGDGFQGEAGEPREEEEERDGHVARDAVE